MERTELQELKDKAFKTNSKVEWDAVMQEIKNAVEGDKYATETLRNYCKALLPKKTEWWSKKAQNKPSFTAKPKMMFSEDTDKAIGELAKALTKYLNSKQNG